MSVTVAGLNAMIDAAVKCTKCHLGPRDCRCWISCWCGHSYEREKAVMHEQSPHHQAEVRAIRAKFPRGRRVQNTFNRHGERATVTGHCLFPHDDWIRLRYDNLRGGVSEPHTYFGEVTTKP